jgi:hypothetical protein
MRGFSALERLVVGLQELLGRGLKHPNLDSGVVIDSFQSLTFPARYGEDSFLQIERRLSGNVAWMDGYEASRVPGFDPVNRRMVVPLVVDHPYITMVAGNPGSRMADDPVVRKEAGQHLESDDLLPTGYQVPLDLISQEVGRTGKQAVIHIVVVIVERIGGGKYTLRDRREAWRRRFAILLRPRATG